MTNGPPNYPVAAGISMTLGVLSNIIALFILAKAYARMRRRSKATFLLFASSLVATDLAGHIISGAVVLRFYSSGVGSGNSTYADPTCQFLGGSMVFFGLCPLFLGSAMAAERCLGVTQPLLHARLVSGARTKMALVLIWLLALAVALLPSVRLGEYSYQHPGTWCFIKVLGETTNTDKAFLLLFTALGLGSLAMSLVCNTISGVTLVRARLNRRKCHRRTAKSHDIEMVAQLLGIMITSCICWSPLLVCLSRKGGVYNLYSNATAFILQIRKFIFIQSEPQRFVFMQCNLHNSIQHKMQICIKTVFTFAEVYKNCNIFGTACLQGLTYIKFPCSS